MLIFHKFRFPALWGRNFVRSWARQLETILYFHVRHLPRRFRNCRLNLRLETKAFKIVVPPVLQPRQKANGLCKRFYWCYTEPQSQAVVNFIWFVNSAHFRRDHIDTYTNLNDFCPEIIFCIIASKTKIHSFSSHIMLFILNSKQFALTVWNFLYYLGDTVLYTLHRLPSTGWSESFFDRKFST